MRNLNRALRMALQYKWSLAGSIICSAFVALLWGANLGAVYPFVEVVLRNKSLHQWADENILESRNQIAAAEKEIAAEKKSLPQLAGAELESAENRLKTLATDITMHEDKIASTQKIQPYIAKYAPKDPFQTLVWLIVLMVIGTVLRGLSLMGSMVSVARVSQRTILDIQNKVFGRVLDMEMSELGVKGTGDLVGRIRGETNVIGRSIATLFGKTIREPMKMFACLAGAAFVNWRLLILSLLICPVAGYLMIKLARMTKRANKRAMEESANLMNRLYQAITYMRVVKSSTMEDHERQRFSVVAKDVYRKGIRIAIYNALSRMNNELLSVSMVSLSVLAGGYLVLNHQTHLFNLRMSATEMDFGRVVLFFTFLVGVADPLRKMADVYNTLQGGIVAADRVFPLIDQLPAVQSPETPTPLPTGKLDVRFENVHFEYEEGAPVLNSVTFDIPAGTSLAIVGHNGCGKSTAINLLPRFFDAGKGRVLVGGVDVRDASLNELRQKIGYVTQLTMLFNDTIGTNIAYGMPDATPMDVQRAAEKAHAHKFIAELEEGYDSSIGEHGGKLSGGQRQRLSLARAILKDPSILILDEATSQIDPESEALIHKTMAEFIQGRTTVVITHRLSTLELVDRIMVMAEGKVVDVGTHEQLLARCPDYRRLRQVDLEGAA